MTRNWKNKSAIFWGVIGSSALLLPSFSFVSCKSSHVSEDESQIKLFETQQTVYEHAFSMPFTISTQPHSPVCVEIINDTTNQISIKEQQIFVKSASGQINFEIGLAVEQTADFHFGVEFVFINSSNHYQKIEINDLNVYYIDDPIDPLDEVVCPQKSVSNVNDHNFIFRFQFYKRPKTEQARIRLLDDTTGTLELEESLYSIRQVPDHNIFYFDAKIKLSLSESRTSEHPFSAEIDFFNSSGTRQKTVVSPLNAFFISDPIDTIPMDYYNVVGQSIGGENRYVLLGLKPEISRSEAGRYERMILPDEVTDIAPGAFIDRRWFAEVDYIKFGPNVKSVGELAFAGCEKTFELDLSLQDKEHLDSWLNEECDDGIFRNLDYEHGFVWFSDDSDIEICDCLDKLKTKGLQSGWVGDLASLIVPDDFYLFNSDPDHEGELIGFDDGKKFLLQRYKVVRLPKKTTVVAANALDDVSNMPYRTNVGGKIELRHLLLSKNISELHCLPRGVCGNVTFRCYSLHKLEKGIADHMYQYPQHDLPFADDLSFDIKWLSGLQEIEDEAFVNSGIKGTIHIPQSVRKIGKRAFDMTSIDRLVLSYPIWQNGGEEENIGGSAFGHIMFAKEVDFSIYTKLPYWLKQKQEGYFNFFDGLQSAAACDATFYVNKDTTDDDLKEWKNGLWGFHSVPVDGISPAEHTWKVVRRPY